MAFLHHCFCDEITGLETTPWSNSSRPTHDVYRRPDGVCVPILKRDNEAPLHPELQTWRLVRCEYCGPHPAAVKARQERLRDARAQAAQKAADRS